MATKTRNALGIDPCDSQNHAIFNATTQKRNVVDTRTGLFEAYVPLPKVTGNEGRGPVVDLSLFYTPVVNNHGCLGDGWSFAFTYYNENLKKLTLSTGEVLDFEKGAGKDLMVSSIKVSYSKEIIRVVLADGRYEDLAKVGSTDFWLPKRLRTVEGFEMSLVWEAAVENSVTYIRLSEVKDKKHQLAGIDYGTLSTDFSRTVTITLWPTSDDEKLVYTLLQKDYALQSITAPDGRAVALEYLDHAKCGWLLSSITAFEGVKETVEYTDNGLVFKTDKKLSALPCVSLHTMKLLGDGPTVSTAYTYTRVDDDGCDYKTVTKCGARETVLFYKNHAVINEEESEGLAKLTTTYSMTDSSSLGRREVKRKYIILDQVGNEARTRSESDTTDWVDGKISNRTGLGSKALYFYGVDLPDLKSSTPPGLTLVSVAGSKAGGDGVKYSALNVVERLPAPFVSQKLSRLYACFKRGHELTLEMSGRDCQWNMCEEGARVERPAMIKCTAYNAWRKPLEVGLCLNQSLDDDPVWITSQNVYGNFSPEDLASGRIASSNNGIAFIKYGYSLSSTELTTTTTQTVDGSARESSETYSILSGRLINQKDCGGNASNYVYDAHGRLISLTQCAQSEAYKQVTTYAYPELGRVETTEPDGQRCATEDDGQGNVLAEYVYDVPGKKWRQMLKVEYDDRGRKSKTTHYDYLADGTQVSETCELEYDNWGQECEQIYSSGLHTFNQYDPVTLTRTEWSGAATDQERKVTTYHEDESVAKVEWKGNDGEVYQTQAFTYTHAFQVATQITDGPHGRHEISYTYDAAGRPLLEAHVERESAEATDATMTYSFSYEYPHDVLIREASKISLDSKVLGERSFDDWGRVTSLTRGGVKETFTYEGASSVPASKTDAAKKTLNYTYVPELGQQIESIVFKDDKNKEWKKAFTYMHGGTKTSSASEGEQLLELDHDLNKRMTEQRTKKSKKATSTVKRSSSPAGRLISEVDAAGAKITYTYNAKGQRTSVEVDAKSVATHGYDTRGRLSSDVVTQGTDKLSVLYTYDTQDREVKRRFLLAPDFDLMIYRTYYTDGKLSSIRLHDVTKKTDLGSHTYAYSPGGRLSSCTSTGVWQPKTPKGKLIDKQAFTHGPMGNVTSCVTTFGKEKCISTYTYEADKGYRLQSVAHDHADYKAATLTYDTLGRVTKDINGKTFAYDWLSRLIQAGSRHYSYDPSDHLAGSSAAAGNASHQLIYDGFKVRGEYPVDGGTDTRRMLPGSSACQVQFKHAGKEKRTLLNLCDDDGTVLISFDVTSRKIYHHAYTAYGEHSSDEQGALHGFNGEYVGDENEQYPLGHGYRWYSPQSMQFQAQDSLSPFDEGGPHAYGYCDGDPVNFKDSNGHWKLTRSHWDYTASEPAPMSLGKHGALISTILWTAIGVLTAAVTGGTSLILTAIMVTLAVAAMATAIAAVVVSESDPAAAKILGGISLVLTVAGGVGQLLKKAAVLVTKLGRSGLSVARRVASRAVVAVQRQPLVRAALARRGIYVTPARAARYEPSYGYRSWDTAATSRRTLTQLTRPIRHALKPFDLGDVNTVVCSVTGVGNLNSSDDNSAWIRSDVNNLTGLPWGSFGLGDYGRFLKLK